MTDLSTAAPIRIRRPGLKRPGLPGLAIGASLTGLLRLMGDAFRLAYVTPYAGPHRPKRTAAEDDLEGRDPTW
ncbi:hypothetical protein [Taklimakanibacter lacteus]|uniref:hypothetical protein n=1 Tax=Taklimakanibacter lacteus TaxID=2268456 RepID=UPI000E66AB04